MAQDRKKELKRDYSKLDDTDSRWYVMLHRNPQLVDLMLKRENTDRLPKRGRQSPIEYFIPFCFLSHVAEKTSEEQAKSVIETNNLREDFHDFVFIHATERGIAKLLDQDWNKDIRNHLRHFRDFQKREVTIGDKEMNTLIRVFSERKLKYSIGLPLTNVSPDMNVYIMKKGIFNGQSARVVDVKHMPDGISLTLGIKLFQGTRELKLPDFRLANIQSEKKPDDIIGWEFISETEAALIDILSRRVNHKETDETRRQDADTLNSKFLYSYITITDTAVVAHFLALMLICSTLRFDRESTKALSARARALLENTDLLPPYIQAYLHLSLYVASRDADHRTAAKHCMQQNSEEKNESLARLASLAGRLRGKRKRNSNKPNNSSNENNNDFNAKTSRPCSKEHSD